MKYGLDLTNESFSGRWLGGGRGRKDKYLKTASCFYKVMGQPFAIHQLTNAGKSGLIGTPGEWGQRATMQWIFS